jgi:asparagine synthetase B (glutamine-hydrolysing)
MSAWLAGDQPLFNEDKSISVCVNGEIYNYKELFAKILEKHPDKTFKTASDCEVGVCVCVWAPEAPSHNMVKCLC